MRQIMQRLRAILAYEESAQPIASEESADAEPPSPGRQIPLLWRKTALRAAQIREFDRPPRRAVASMR